MSPDSFPLRTDTKSQNRQRCSPYFPSKVTILNPERLIAREGKKNRFLPAPTSHPKGKFHDISVFLMQTNRAGDLSRKINSIYLVYSVLPCARERHDYREFAT